MQLIEKEKKERKRKSFFIHSFVKMKRDIVGGGDIEKEK